MRTMRSIKRLVTYLTLAAAPIVAAACHIENDERAGAAKMIGVTLPTRDTAFYRDLEEGLRSAADKHGYQLIISWADSKLGAQESAIDSFMTQHVDAIIICPVDPVRIRPAIQKANALRVPVFTLDMARNARNEGVQAISVVSDYFDGKKLPPHARTPVHLVDAVPPEAAPSIARSPGT